MNPAKKHFLLPQLLITQEQSTHQSSIAELFIFLVQYSFLCNEPSSGDKILKRDVSYSGELSSQKSNGARYLDPKYSRWISVDPALGEYVPQAPINDEAKKHNQNLPGMGGLFNSVNLNLFHYAGNNPVRYMDPDGRDIEETPIISVSIGVLGAARASAGFAIDSDEAAAIYCKLELGIGAGTSIGLSKLFSGAIQKTFNLMSKIIGYLNNSMSGVEIGKDIVNIPEDTGAGNLEWKYLDCIDIRWETEKNWKTPPVEAALFIGLQVDKNNEWSLDAPSCIASAYLCSITIYVNTYKAPSCQ